jgi:hypothetical protein
MKILSIDVGIKNLALCVLETEKDNNYKIRYWDVINLCEEKTNICEFNIVKKGKKGKKDNDKDKDKDKDYQQCCKEAKYHKNGHFYCKTHAAKSQFKLPTSDLNKYKRFKIDELKKLVLDYEISIIGPSYKTNLIEHIDKYIEKHVFENVSAMKCRNYSLIDIGCAIKENLDKLDTFIFSNIDLILIENQISPIANRMNCIQGMLSQYFIMKEMNNIKFVSAANKLKSFIGDKKTTYGERKKISIEETKKLLAKMNLDNIEKDKIIDMFNKHKKKDDLADCFLQGIWYISEKVNV